MARHLIAHVCHCGAVFHRFRSEKAKNCSRECRAVTRRATYYEKLRSLLAKGVARRDIAKELELFIGATHSAIYRMRKRDERSNREGRAQPDGLLEVGKIDNAIRQLPLVSEAS